MRLYRLMFLLFALNATIEIHASQKSCLTPKAHVTSSVVRYTIEKYHLPATSLILKDAIKANDDCYWKYTFQIPQTGREIVLYLAPDHRYLTPTLYDRDVDPIDEEIAAARVEQENLEKFRKHLTEDKSPSRGLANAPVTLVEFSDFQCPFCQRFTAYLEHDVLPSHPEVRVVFKYYPLAMHPWAKTAAEIIACGDMQGDGVFWKLHDYVFENQKTFTPNTLQERLISYADSQPDIDHKAFHDCVAKGSSAEEVARDQDLGNKVGVHGTPTFFINGVRIDGVRDSTQLLQFISDAKGGKLSQTSVSQVSTARNVMPLGNACVPATSQGGLNVAR